MQNFSSRAVDRFVYKTKELKQATISTFLVDNNRIHSVILDMNSTDAMKTNFKFKQYDYGTCFLSIQLVDDSTPIDIIGKTILGTFRDSSGNIFLDENNSPLSATAKALISSDGVIEMAIPKKVLRKTGNMDCEMVVFDNVGNRMTSPRFSFYIEPSMFDHEEYVPPSNSAICGEALCGDVICGAGNGMYIDEQYEINTNLSYEFLNRFKGGEING